MEIGFRFFPVIVRAVVKYEILRRSPLGMIPQAGLWERRGSEAFISTRFCPKKIAADIHCSRKARPPADRYTSAGKGLGA